MLGIEPRIARATWTAIVIVLLCVMLYAIRHTLFIFVVSLLFAYLLLPLVDFIDRVLPMKGSRTPALAIVYLFLVAGLVLTGVEIGAQVAEQANTLAQRVSDFLKPEQTGGLPLPQPIKPMGDRLLSAVRAAIQEHYQEILQTLPRAALGAVGAATNLIFIVIVPILSFFFLKDGRMLQRYVMAQIDDKARRGVLAGIAADLNVLLAQYMRALVLLGLAAAVAYGTFFTIMGVPYAVLLAALAFPLEFIPMLGPITSSAIILLVTGFSGYPHVLAIAVFLAVFRIFQDYVLAPYLMSAGMELHPLLIVFGVFAGEQIAGVPGAFLSVPVMAVLRIVYRRLERARVQQEITAHEPVLTDQ
jgi:predicted PurR-regulated permease PerM